VILEGFKGSGNQGFELNAEELQRIEGLAKILSALLGGLQNNGEICQRGKIRFNLAAETLGGIGDEIQPVERMLKALIKTLANKHLNPRPPESSTTFPQRTGRRALFVHLFAEI